MTQGTERVQVVLTSEWEITNPGLLVGLARVLAGRAGCTLSRDGVDGEFTFEPDPVQRAELAAREITTAAEALEWLLLDALPRELAGAEVRCGAVAGVELASVAPPGIPEPVA